MKVIDRILYKLDELVRPYVHKILVVGPVWGGEPWDKNTMLSPFCQPLCQPLCQPFCHPSVHLLVKVIDRILYKLEAPTFTRSWW